MQIEKPHFFGIHASPSQFFGKLLALAPFVIALIIYVLEDGPHALVRAELVAFTTSLQRRNYLKTKSHRESLWLREGVYISYCPPKGNDFPHSRRNRSVLERSLPHHR